MLPDAAKAKTSAGAEAFVRFYIDLINSAVTLPKPGLLPPYSDRGCLFCQGIEKDVNKLASEGHRYADEPLEVGELVEEQAPVDQVIFVSDMTQRAVQVVDSEGHATTHSKAGEMPIRIAAIWTGTGWQFFDLEKRAS